MYVGFFLEVYLKRYINREYIYLYNVLVFLEYFGINGVKNFFILLCINGSSEFVDVVW